METIAKIIHGSHLYGLNTEKSDKDYKGIFIPNNEDIVIGKTKLGSSSEVYTTSTGDKDGKNNKDDIDVQNFSLARFVYECLRGEMIAIDMLHASKEFILIDSPEYEFLRKNRSDFYCKDMKSYIGYIRRQVYKYGIKGSRLSIVRDILNFIQPLSLSLTIKDVLYQLPIDDKDTEIITKISDTGKEIFYYRVFNKEFHESHEISGLYKSMNSIMENSGGRARLAMENRGIDYKAVSHAFRACFQLQSIYQIEDVVLPFSDGIKKRFLLQVKNGDIDFDYMSEVMDEEITKTLELSEQSNLPKKPDYKKWTKWVTDIYINKIKLN